MEWHDIAEILLKVLNTNQSINLNMDTKGMQGVCPLIFINIKMKKSMMHATLIVNYDL
jgi:hypothetical protein